MRVRWLTFATVTVAASATSLGFTRTAVADAPVHVGVIDRIVAVVDHDVILLSELRDRAKPFQKQLEAVPEGAQRAAAEAQMKHDLLGKMIDEIVVARDAERARLTVTPAEIDAALQTIATSQKLTIPQLFEAARGAGLDEAGYRAEIRRQLLEGRLLQNRVLWRIKGLSALSESERAARIEKERQQLLQELRSQVFIELRQ